MSTEKQRDKGAEAQSGKDFSTTDSADKRGYPTPVQVDAALAFSDYNTGPMNGITAEYHARLEAQQAKESEGAR